MNKTLIAMAVAGLMAAPMAAQADATIYGKIHASLDFGDTGLDGEGADSTYWQSNSSRLGFKGSEDLGGRLKAIWQIENSIGVGSSSSAWATRNTYVGLQGGWGTLLGGKHDTPFKTTGRKFDLFGDYVGDTRNLISGKFVDTDTGDSSIGFDLRPDNALMYKSPVFGNGWDITAMYTFEDGDKDSEIMSANVTWKTGNWHTSLAYESHGKGNNVDLDGGNIGDQDETGIRLGVKWTPGGWNLNAMYETLSDVAGYSGVDSDVYGLGVGYKFGKNMIKGQYYVTSNSISGANDIDATLMAIAFDHNFSKRTTGYIAYASTSNDANVYYGVDGSGHGGEINSTTAALQAAAVAAGGPGTDVISGKDPSAISIGVIHKF